MASGLQLLLSLFNLQEKVQSAPRILCCILLSSTSLDCNLCFLFPSLFSQLTTLRGSVLEDAVPSTSKHGTTRGLPIKDVLEYLLPELDLSCLRLALNTPKVTEQLMKLDEQGVGGTDHITMCNPLSAQGRE